MIRRPPRSTRFPYTTPVRAERVVTDLLANPLIHQWRITAAADWHNGPAAFLPPPVAGVDKPPLVQTVSLERDDEALRHLSQERSEEHTSELQSRQYIVCRLL